MANQEQIEAAWQALRERWEDQGACGSCGWHAALYEHGVDDAEISEALDTGGVLELPCLSDNEDPSLHRGVRVDISSR